VEQLSRLGCNVKFIPSGVDTERFCPVTKEKRCNLRRKYGFSVNESIVLHVGHINRRRNLQLLKRIQQVDGNQVLIVGSTSTPQDGVLKEELEQSGIRCITQYLAHIEELYQLSDCYVFPVMTPGAAIDVPLSVLEAMACDLPVVTMRFGGLTRFIEEKNGFMFADTEAELVAIVEIAKKFHAPKTRIMANLFSWENLSERILLESISSLHCR
jgi:glycosyltransferase involved in cell wall biosynthesis